VSSNKYKFSSEDYGKFLILQSRRDNKAMKRFAESWLSFEYATSDTEYQEKMLHTGRLLLEKATKKRITQNTKIIMSLFLMFVVEPFLEQFSSQSKIRRRLAMAIRNAHRKNCKGISIIENLPYTIEQLVTHLENHFQEGMDWRNYGRYEGQWSMDHIYPRSRLPYDSANHPNFQKCWSLKNLRPMWTIDNWTKSDSIPDE